MFCCISRCVIVSYQKCVNVSFFWFLVFVDRCYMHEVCHGPPELRTLVDFEKTLLNSFDFVDFIVYDVFDNPSLCVYLFM